MALPLVLDVLLAVGLLAVAAFALFLPRREPAVVMFLAFGLLLATVWGRLGAPDVALAEAAIGAGVTTALLMDAVRAGRPDAAMPLDRPSRSRALPVLAGLLGGLLAVVLLVAASALRRPAGLRGDVEARLADSGVSHPVTAVLLNFRGYDTLLEVAVLLVAVLAALSLHPGGRLDAVPVPPPAPPVLDALVRVLTPVSVLLAAWLLVAGSSQPGGAFQAGALLAGGLVLLRVAGRPVGLAAGGWLVPLLAAGLGAFLLVAVLTAGLGGGWLDLPAAWAGPVILAVEAAVAVSIAVTLAALFVADQPPGPLEEPHP